jgi:hypothetical protein
MQPRKDTLFPVATNRRGFLNQAGGGLGALALYWLLRQERPGVLAETLTPQTPQFPSPARSVIYLFMHGGPSHL